jgi:hypothetical protein
MKLTLCLALMAALPGAALAADPETPTPPAPVVPTPAAPPPVPEQPPPPPGYLPPPPPDDGEPPAEVGPRRRWIRYHRRPMQTPEELEAERKAYEARGGRPTWYAGMLVYGAGFAEDPDYRLTTRKTRLLEGVSGTLRLGGVIDAHSRFGVRMQGFLRPTKALVGDPVPYANRDWGSVQVGFIGPEYIYTTSRGVYAAASVGIAGASSSDGSDCRDRGYYGGCDRHHDNTLRSSFGGGALASLGYEWRVARWFAISTEVFGGVLLGMNDQEQSTTSEVFGAGIGIGF